MRNPSILYLRRSPGRRFGRGSVMVDSALVGRRWERVQVRCAFHGRTPWDAVEGERRSGIASDLLMSTAEERGHELEPVCLDRQRDGLPGEGVEVDRELALDDRPVAERSEVDRLGSRDDWEGEDFLRGRDDGRECIHGEEEAVSLEGREPEQPPVTGEGSPENSAQTHVVSF